MIQVTRELDIVFIMGIMPRSGTHFLANLLCQHPDCKKSILPEDSLIATAGYLTTYTNVIFNRWKQQADLPDIDCKLLLMRSLGAGLINFLKQAKAETTIQKKSSSHLSPAIKYLVTKTPQVKNINVFFDFFPNNKLLILVRDGRALVESIHLSFQNKYETAMKDWAIAADDIINFERKWKDKGKSYLIIKYEDLHEQTEREMRKIFSFLELDPDIYHFQSALNLPVTGSSSFKRGDGAVHWMPVSKTNEFNPLTRALGWSRARHERFNWIAKKQLAYFGYEQKTFTNRQTYWLLHNRVMDSRVYVTRQLRRLTRLAGFVMKIIKTKPAGSI